MKGLYLSVTCMEDTQCLTPEARTQASAGTFLGDYRVDEQLGACNEWGVPAMKLPEGRIEVPLLLLAGERDHVTPVAGAREVAADAPQSRVVVFPQLGHLPDGVDHLECLDTIMAAFFAAGSARDLDTSCVATMTAPAFALRNEEERN